MISRQKQQKLCLQATLLALFATAILANEDNDKNIIGGVPVAAGTYPYYCVSSDPGFCGCSLIAGDILLTAAHCRGAFLPGQTVYLGGIQRDGSDATATVTVQEQFIHPSWSFSAYENDYLVLKIAEDMSAIPLPALNADGNFPADQSVCLTMGFGITEDFETSDILLQVQLDILSQDSCNDAWSEFLPVTDSMICAGSEYGRGTCSGDSGSPLVCDGVIVGITSWGSGNCPDERPSVFARVSEGDQFIKEGICKMTELTEPAYCDQFTSSPTMSPTDLPPAPANDDCANAIEISGSTVSGSTLGATFDDVGFCGTINSGPGIWYTIEGDGSAIVIDTCEDTSFDTRLTVFEGGCGSLSCVTGNDQTEGSDCSPNGSRVQWFTQVGTTYYILVHGTFTFAGSFTMKVESFVPPENDSCADAISVAVGSTVSGTTQLATSDPDFTECFWDNQSAGVWYKVVGTGATIRASTCEGTSIFFDTVLQVFTSCGTRSCVADNDQSCGSRSSVEFETVDGDEYYILVNSYYDQDSDSFELKIEEVTGGGDDDDNFVDDGIGSSLFDPFAILAEFLCFLRSLIDILPGDWSC